MAFDSAGSFSFDNEFARNVIIFDVIVYHLILKIAKVTF